MPVSLLSTSTLERCHVARAPMNFISFAPMKSLFFVVFLPMKRFASKKTPSLL